MDREEARELMVNAMNAQIEALRSYQKERSGLQSWHRVEQARKHADAMKEQFVRISAQLNEPIEEITE
jgi:hypothetical protein